MKKGFYFIVFTVLVLIPRFMQAQAPQGIPYQGVVRNSFGQVMASKSLLVRVSLLDSIATGKALYVERHQPTTTSLGLFSLTVGTGTLVTGNFSTIDWSKNAKFLKVEVDTTASGFSYADMGTQQLLSVPYALYAGSAGATVSGKLPTILTDTVVSIGYRTATVKASLTDRGSKLILARGICLGTTTLPTEETANTVAGSTLGSFEYAFSELNPNTKYYARAFATTTAGTAYGREISFTTTALKVPVVTTDTVLNISTRSALVGGKISDEGGSSITQRGVVWGRNNNPTLSDSVKLAEGSSSFNATLLTLTPSTLYHVRAYATNAQGTGYGSDRSFTTGSLSLATITTAVMGNTSSTSGTGSVIVPTVSAQVTSDGGSTVTQRGVCYNTSSGPTLSNTVVSGGSGTGSFTVTLNNLTAGTTYYLRAFATNAAGTYYSSEISYSTVALTTPQVNTLNIYGISTNAAASGGNVVSDGGLPVTQRGVCWNTQPSPTISNFYSSNGSGAGSFNAPITGLLLNTTYYVRAYAINSKGISYGSEYSFTTTSIIATPTGTAVIGTGQVTRTDSNYVAAGYVSTDGGSAILEMGVCWNKIGNPTIADSVKYFTPVGTGFFTIPVSLPYTCQETYYFRSFVRNGNGLTYASNQQTIGTGLKPKMGSTSVSSIQFNSATVTAEILEDGGCSVTERGVCWSPNVGPTISSIKSTNGTGSGLFIISLTNLIPNTTYYYRSYAISNMGTFYGEEKSFVTTTPTGLYVGQEYAGGIIFYLDSTGQHGMVVTSSDVGSARWGYEWQQYNTNRVIVGCSDTSVGSGERNTAAIIAAIKNNQTAAYKCDELVMNGYNDWFLPSRGEMRLVYENLFLNGVGNFNISEFDCIRYWTSTEYLYPGEYAETVAYFLYFNGKQITNPNSYCRNDWWYWSNFASAYGVYFFRAARKF